MSLVYGPNNLPFKGVSRRAVPTDAPDEAADTGDLRVLLCHGRTTQVSLSSQDLALLLDTYVLFGMTLSLLLAFTLQRTEERAIRRTDDTRVDGCLSGRR